MKIIKTKRNCNEMQYKIELQFIAFITKFKKKKKNKRKHKF